MNPKISDPLRLAADWMLERGRFKEAAQAYYRILQGAPDDADALVALGVCFLKTGDLDTAGASFERALEISPNNALATESLAVVRQRFELSHGPSSTSALSSTPSNSVNEPALDAARRFWDSETLSQAMFERMFTDPSITGMTDDEQQAAWEKSALDSMNQVLDGFSTSPDWRVLEIGCGVGRILKPLRTQFARVDGVDISEKMIEFAKGYLLDSKGHGEVHLNNGHDLGGLPDYTYDLVFSTMVFQQIRSASVVRNYFREALRVLKLGGFFRIQVHQYEPDRGRCDEEAESGVQHGFIGNTYTVEELQSLLEETGFAIDSVIERGKLIWATARRTPIALTNPPSVANDAPKVSRPRVSVLVSAYKSERFIRGCLEDLVRQTIANQIEIIVVDSASPENERAIVEEFQGRHPNIIYLRTKERETLYASWNRGIQRARGQYITNANTDDRHSPDALERLAQALDQQPELDLVYGDSLVTRNPDATWANSTAKGVFRWPEFDVRQLFDVCCMGPHPMWRRSVHDRHGTFDPEYRSAGDYEFWLRLAVAGCRMQHLREIVGIYLENPDSVSLSDGSLSWRESERARDKHWPKPWGPRPTTAWRSCEQPWDEGEKLNTPTRDEQLRVLLACDFFWPSVGGVELYVEDLALRLREAGCEVEIACRHLPERQSTERHGIRIHSLVCIDVHGFALATPSMQALKALIGNGSFDAVLALTQPDNWLGNAVRELRNSHPRMLLLPSINAMNLEEWRLRGNTNQVREILRSAHQVVAVTESGHDMQFLRATGLSPVFVPHATNRDAAAGHFHASKQLDTARPLLVMVANFWPVKNHAALLRCFKDQRGDWQLVIIGHRIGHFGEYYSEVLDLAAADPRVRVLGGLPREDAASAIRDADLLLVPSRGESAGPLVVLQAMSYGTPWICTPECNAATDEAGGIVAALEEFPAVISYLLDRPELRAELGRLGKAHWQQTMTWEKTLPAFMSLIRGEDEVPDLRLSKALRDATRTIRAQVGNRVLDASVCSLPTLNSPTQYEPIFSIIVPTYNRAATLQRCLEAISNQQFDLNRIEVFVCDDGSTDTTRYVVEGFHAPFLLSYHHQKNSGPAAARNLGIHRAQGRYLLFLNDDAILEPDALRIHLNTHQQNYGRKIAVLGRFTFPSEFTATPFGYALEHSDLLFFYRRMEGGKTYDFNCFFTCNISLPQTALRESGLFDERFDGPAAEDIELGYRLYKCGYQVLYEPRCVAWHHHQMTPEGFCRTHHIRGNAAVTLMIVQPDAPWYPEHDFEYLQEKLNQVKSTAPPLEQFLSLLNRANCVQTHGEPAEALTIKADRVLQALRFLQQYHEMTGMLSNPRLPELIALRKARRHLQTTGPALGVPPLVSVVITCYNYGHFLTEAVESVVAQTFRDFEIIIVNDGSTDKSPQVARELILKHTSRCPMRLLDGPNSGQPAAARNNGICQARGRYILCLDADDKIAPTFLDKTVSVLELHAEVGVVYGHIQHFGQRCDIYACGEFQLDILARDNVLPYCALYRREIWEAVGGYRLNVRGYEDWDFWLSICEQGWKGHLVPEPLFCYRKHGASLLTGANRNRQRLLAAVVLNHPNLYDNQTLKQAQDLLKVRYSEPVAAAEANPRLNITYLISSILGVTGGNQTLLGHVNGLVARGHKVTVVTYTPKPAHTPIHTHVVQVPQGRRMSDFVPKSDVVVATYFANAVDLAQIEAPVKIYYAQGDQYVFADNALNGKQHDDLRQLSDLSYQMEDVFILPNSQNLANAVRSRTGRLADSVLPVMVNREIFQPASRTATPNIWRILVVGPDSRGSQTEPLTFKGIADIRDALRLLTKHTSKFHVLRMSSTPPDLFANTQCEFYQAPPKNLKTQLYGTADILVYASHYDSCPRPPLEAMSAGCAVICTDTTGSKEYCQNGVNCRMVPIKNPQAIAEALWELMSDSALLYRIVQGGLVTAERLDERHEIDLLESKFIQFRQRVNAGKRPFGFERPGTERPTD
jgi:glycosyltransferase involved in cell wall biosynthesis/predicted TPR repeat methyltransferase